MSEKNLYAPAYYINRELSHIEFNRRVLKQTLDTTHPLLERVKFLAIFNSNMDEFFMVRVSGLKQQLLLDIRTPPPDGMTPRQQLAAIHETVTNLTKEAMDIWQNHLLPELTNIGIHILEFDELKKRQQKKLNDYFENKIFPVLTPLAFDPGRPFPHISNLSLNLAVVIKDPETQDTFFARVKVPSTLPRFVPLKQIDPDELLLPKEQKLIPVEQIIAANLNRLFPGMEIVAVHPFRVTRNTDMEIQEEEADDLLLTMEQHLQERHFGVAVRLELDSSIPQWIRDIFISNLNVGTYDVYIEDGPLGLNSLWELHKLDRAELKDLSFQPAIPSTIRNSPNIFSTLQQRDILLHHPYDSFTPVVDFIEAAAKDPDVLAIKQTLYRVGSNPPIVHSLMKARENGKQVAVLVELKARFDEESNIEWARALEKAGVHVVYGLIGLKTHCKICLVVRRERDTIRRYVHLSTGNYNTTTARIYTDFALMTSNQEIGADCSELFNYLTGYSKQTNYRKCLVAPLNLRRSLLRFIQAEAAHGTDGHIIIKCNSLVDPPIIRALYRASQAGVKIELLVRGICCLRPQIAGVSETIRVISIIGRFLEHSRVYYFKNQGDIQLYAGSADLMPRNIDRRVELLFPIEDSHIQTELLDILRLSLNDTTLAHELQSDGSYKLMVPPPDTEPVNSQQFFLNGHIDD